MSTPKPATNGMVTGWGLLIVLAIEATGIWTIIASDRQTEAIVVAIRSAECAP